MVEGALNLLLLSPSFWIYFWIYVYWNGEFDWLREVWDSVELVDKRCGVFCLKDWRELGFYDEKLLLVVRRQLLARRILILDWELRIITEYFIINLLNFLSFHYQISFIFLLQAQIHIIKIRIPILLSQFLYLLNLSNVLFIHFCLYFLIPFHQIHLFSALSLISKKIIFPLRLATLAPPWWHFMIRIQRKIVIGKLWFDGRFTIWHSTFWTFSPHQFNLVINKELFEII